MTLLGQKGMENRMDMMLRDTIALEAMKIVFPSPTTAKPTLADVANIAYALADAMMEARQFKRDADGNLIDTVGL